MLIPTLKVKGQNVKESRQLDDTLQVAQLSQRDRAKLDKGLLFQLTSGVIRKCMHKIEFLGHPMGASGAIYALHLKFLTQRNLVAEFHRDHVSFTRKTAN